eukprot:7061563-Pyramimonas_sp.AAC.2
MLLSALRLGPTAGICSRPPSDWSPRAPWRAPRAPWSGRPPACGAPHSAPSAPPVGFHTAIKPLLSRSTTGKFKSPPKYVRTPKKRPS